MRLTNVLFGATFLRRKAFILDCRPLLGTGYIEFEEFLTILQKKIQADEDERELREIFRVLDKEKKGEVNVNELRWILKNLGDDLTEEDIDDMIADVDTDGSGWVDYDGRWPHLKPYMLTHVKAGRQRRAGINICLPTYIHTYTQTSERDR